MSLHMRLACLALFVVVVCNASEATDEKTTEAVVKAVVQAESQPKVTPKNAEESKEAKVEEAASAVAKATTGVLNSETSAGSLVSEEVIKGATHNAEQTFKELADDGVAPKAAADAAAKVAVETVDGASDLSLPQEAKVNAEKAAIAAGEAVAENPDSQAVALTEAISTVKKEEQTPGKALQKEKSKGIVATASAVVSDLPKLAEEGATTAATKVESSNPVALVFMALAIAAVFAGVRSWETIADNTPYIKRLRAIREEFDGNGAPSADYERDIETQYKGFSEMQPFCEH